MSKHRPSNLGNQILSYLSIHFGLCQNVYQNIRVFIKISECLSKQGMMMDIKHCACDVGTVYPTSIL